MLCISKLTVYQDGINIKTGTYKSEVGVIIDINIITQQESSSVGQWDLFPGKQDIRVLLMGRQKNGAGGDWSRHKVLNKNKQRQWKWGQWFLIRFHKCFVESNPYPALACIPASAGAAVEALRSNSTRKSCISHPAGSWLKVKEDITKSLSCS